MNKREQYQQDQFKDSRVYNESMSECYMKIRLETDKMRACEDNIAYLFDQMRLIEEEFIGVMH